jgi:hypothetical protein
MKHRGLVFYETLLYIHRSHECEERRLQLRPLAQDPVDAIWADQPTPPGTYIKSQRGHLSRTETCFLMWRVWQIHPRQIFPEIIDSNINIGGASSYDRSRRIPSTPYGQTSPPHQVPLADRSFVCRTELLSCVREGAL